MPASTNLIGNLGSIITAGPNAATTAKAIAYGGPIIDYTGLCRAAQLKLQAVVAMLGLSGTPKGLITVTDSTDTANLALLTAVSNALTGGNSPSATLITAMGTVETNGPNSATTTKAIAYGGPIIDYIGVIHLVRERLKEVVEIISSSSIPEGLIAVTDSTDSTNLTYLQNIATALT